MKASRKPKRISHTCIINTIAGLSWYIYVLDIEKATQTEMFPGMVGGLVGLDLCQKVETTFRPSLGFTRSPAQRAPELERKEPECNHPSSCNTGLSM
jgi:hypothetical protein